MHRHYRSLHTQPDSIVGKKLRMQSHRGVATVAPLTCGHAVPKQLLSLELGEHGQERLAEWLTRVRSY